MPKLEDLPTEILLNILDHPAAKLQNELFFLALLSRRFHFLSLPLFLRSHGITNAPQRAEITLSAERRPPDEMDALNIALFIPSFRHLSFTLRHDSYLWPDTKSALQAVCRGLERFQHFLTNLKKPVERCVVDINQILTNYYRDLSSAFTYRMNVIHTLENILNRAIQRASKLTVAGETSSEIVNFVRVGAGPIRQSRFRFLRSGRLPEEEWEYQYLESPKTFPHFDLRILSKKILNTLAIQSTLLLAPPFLKWTLDVLELKALTRLELSDIRFKNDHQWKFVLSTISRVALHLLELSIQDCDLEFTTLLPFLFSVPTLQKLDIHDTVSSQTCPGVSEKKILSNLSHLSAPRYIIWFFVDNPKLSPKLGDLCIYESPLTTSEGMMLDSFNNSLSEFHERIDRQDYHARQVKPTFSVHCFSGFHRELALCTKQFLAREYCASGTTPSFVGVQRVTLLLGDSLWDAPIPTICDWLNLFPSATDVELRLPGIYQRDVETLSTAIGEKCKGVRSLVMVVGLNYEEISTHFGETT